MIEIDQLTKRYGTGDRAVTVLDHLDLAVPAGHITAVVGPSGAGKSTLAQCIGLLELPTSGRVIVNGEELSSLRESKLRLARRRIGTIFQADGLLSRRTAAQNVALPLEYRGVDPSVIDRRVEELLARVGLADKADHYPFQLSGGQRQRVGIARALALKPKVLLSDEATSGLDPTSTATIIALLRELRDELDLSILFITHEMDTVLRVADSVAHLDHGRIVEQGRLIDLLRDIDSPLGEALLPYKPGADLPGQRWHVAYSRHDVPGDWVERVSGSAGSVQLVAASVEQVNGEAVGHLTVATDGFGPGEFERRAFESGLVVRPIPGSLAASGIAPAIEAVSA